MRGGPAGHPATDKTVVDHDHLLAFTDERVGDGKPGNASADDTHIGRGCFPAAD